MFNYMLLVAIFDINNFTFPDLYNFKAIETNTKKNLCIVMLMN